MRAEDLKFDPEGVSVEVFSERKKKGWKVGRNFRKKYFKI